MNASRIIWWYIAVLIVFTILFVIQPYNVVAETGNITVQNQTTTPYTQGTPVFNEPVDWTKIYYDSTNYNQLDSWNAYSDLETFTYPYGSTTFTITSGGTGGGVVYFVKEYHKVYFATNHGNVYTSSPLTVSYANATFFNSLTYTVAFGRTNNACTPSVNNPIFICNAAGAKTMAFTMNATASGVATDGYDVTYPGAGLFRINITKSASNAKTKHIIHNATQTLISESAYTNTNDYLVYAYGGGLWDNVTMQGGAFNDVLINATGCAPTCEIVSPLVINPLTGVGIMFDAATYSIGGTANISWNRTNPTPFGYEDDIYLIQPGNIKKLLSSSPPDVGFVKTNDLPVAGTYNVSFERSLLGFGFDPEILATDTATVSAEQASYILVNATVPVGVYTTGNYSAGWTGAGRIVIYQDLPDGTVKEIDSLPITGVCCVENTVSQLFFPQSGNYRIVLMKGYDTVRATASVTAYFSNIIPGANITVSNISLNKNQYTYGEPYTITYQVDSFNFSTKAKRIIAYEVATGANTLINQVPSQTGTITRTFDSEAYPFSGALELRLMGLNATGDYMLANVSFTLSKIDTEGYGLDVTKSPICVKETGYFTYYSPSAVTVTIGNNDVTVYSKNLTSAIAGKTVPFTINRVGNYEIFLRPSNSTDVKFTKIIEVKACEIAVQTPVSGSQQAQQVAAMITTPVFWALIVTAGLMIAIAWRTRDGFAAGSVGMLSAGVFSYMTWLPLWIFFSVLIIAALLLSSSIVAKQLKKTG